jgi:hypothetical protein
MYKSNSRKLLLALAGDELAQIGLPLKMVLQLPIGGTEKSRRSLVYYLAKEGSVWLERHGEVLTVGLTALGQRRLIAQFPALQQVALSSSMAWQLILLKQAPVSDPHFRSLAVLCRKHQVLRLTRGVYAYPGQLPASLAAQLAALYTDENLARCTVDAWVSGFDRPTIVAFYDLEHLSAIYSSISKEIDQLLAAISKNKEIIYQSISNISSVINRLESAFGSDAGLVASYFAETPRGMELVNRLGQLLARSAQSTLLTHKQK